MFSFLCVCVSAGLLPQWQDVGENGTGHWEIGTGWSRAHSTGRVGHSDVEQPLSPPPPSLSLSFSPPPPPLAGRYTTRMSELSVVLRDLERGVYERTMVANEEEQESANGSKLLTLSSEFEVVFVQIVVHRCRWFLGVERSSRPITSLDLRGFPSLPRMVMSSLGRWILK